MTAVIIRIQVMYRNAIAIHCWTAVFGCSGSTDDKSISKYVWEIVSGPIDGMKLDNSDSAMLELKDLPHGTYKIRLTVSDDEGLTNSSMASVVVEKVSTVLYVHISLTLSTSTGPLPSYLHTSLSPHMGPSYFMQASRLSQIPLPRTGLSPQSDSPTSYRPLASVRSPPSSSSYPIHSPIVSPSYRFSTSYNPPPHLIQTPHLLQTSHLTQAPHLIQVPLPRTRLPPHTSL